MYVIKTSNSKSVELYNKIIENRKKDHSMILTNMVKPENEEVVMEVSQLTNIITRNDIKKIKNKNIYIQENVLDIPMFIFNDKNTYRILTSKNTGGMVIGPKGKWAKKLYNIFGVKTINILQSYNTNRLDINMICKLKAENILILKHKNQYLIMNIDLYI